jgi:hypothetical protein
MVAVEPFEPQAPDQATAQDKNYLFDALIARIEQASLQMAFGGHDRPVGRSDK